MAPMAAARLKTLAAGLPTEGENSKHPRAGDIARLDVAVGGPKDRLGDLSARIRAAGLDAAVVVDDDRHVLGLLRGKELGLDPELPVENAMRTGPSTFRPYIPIKEIADYMVEHELESSPVTTSDGKLVGLLLKSDAVECAASATPCVRKMIR